MKQTLVIFNPAARSEKSRRFFQKLAHRSSEMTISETAAPGDAKAFAQKAVRDGVRRVIAAGGDGTINEIVNGIGDADVELGILPLGTMNVFAAELGLPSGNLEKCWKIIANGHVRRIDRLRSTHRDFVQMAGVGFDAQVVKETPKKLKKNIGPLSYLILATQIASRKPPKIEVESAEGNCVGSFVLIGNGRFYGGPFPFFKNAKIDDGLLDVLIFKNLGYLDIMRYAQGVLLGKHLQMKDVEYFQTDRVSVRSEQEVPVEVDGEWIGELPADFEVIPGGLKVLVPGGKT